MKCEPAARVDHDVTILTKNRHPEHIELFEAIEFDGNPVLCLSLVNARDSLEIVFALVGIGVREDLDPELLRVD